MYLAMDGSASKPWSAARIFQVGAALMGGAGLGLLAAPTLKSTTAATPTSLSAMPRASSMVANGPALAALPGNKAWKELALAGMEASQGCHMGFAKPTPRFIAAMANMRKVVMPAAKKSSSAEDLPGAFPPLGFWDPAGFSTDISEGRLAYYREAELKHGRV